MTPLNPTVPKPHNRHLTVTTTRTYLGSTSRVIAIATAAPYCHGETAIGGNCWRLDTYRAHKNHPIICEAWFARGHMANSIPQLTCRRRLT